MLYLVENLRTELEQLIGGVLTELFHGLRVESTRCGLLDVFLPDDDVMQQTKKKLVHRR
jgi:hypothetical protein